MTTALIVEDEPLLRGELREALAALWPELVLCGEAADGIEALRLIERMHPDLLFLDIELPGLSGLEVARQVGAGAHLVFITAFDHYAVQAFEAGAIDYVLKPLALPRLARTLQRAKERLQQAPPDLQQVLAALRQVRPANAPLRWITALQGREVRLITVEDICYIHADHKYTAVVTATDEALITTPLRELIEQLDPEVFCQIHRSTVVNLNAVKSVRRLLGGQCEVVFKARPETLRVSAPYAHRFKQM